MYVRMIYTHFHSSKSDNQPKEIVQLNFHRNVSYTEFFQNLQFAYRWHT